jgi:hypothetical protein
MSPACHVSTEIHKLLEHESERPEGTPIIGLPPSGSRLSWFRDVKAQRHRMMARTAIGSFRPYMKARSGQAGFDVLVIQNPGRGEGSN